MVLKILENVCLLLVRICVSKHFFLKNKRKILNVKVSIKGVSLSEYNFLNVI
jgi:hypothetical protein